MESANYPVWQRLLSIVTCIAALGTCGLAMAWMLKDRAKWAQIAADFKLKVSGSTEIIFQTPDALIWAVLGLFAISSVLALGLIRSPKSAVMLHLALMAVTGVALGIWEKGVSETLLTLTIGMTGGSK